MSEHSRDNFRGLARSFQRCRNGSRRIAAQVCRREASGRRRGIKANEGGGLGQSKLWAAALFFAASHRTKLKNPLHSQRNFDRRFGDASASATRFLLRNGSNVESPTTMRSYQPPVEYWSLNKRRGPCALLRNKADQGACASGTLGPVRSALSLKAVTQSGVDMAEGDCLDPKTRKGPSEPWYLNHHRKTLSLALYRSAKRRQNSKPNVLS